MGINDSRHPRPLLRMLYPLQVKHTKSKIQIKTFEVDKYNTSEKQKVMFLMFFLTPKKNNRQLRFYENVTKHIPEEINNSNLEIMT